jgi:hypothetical protein
MLVRDAVADRAGAEQRVLNALITMIVAGQIQISSLPVRLGRATAVRPEVWRLARLQAAAGEEVASSQQHTVVTLHSGMAVLLPLLDGTLDRPALIDRLAAALRLRETKAAGNGSGHAAPDRAQFTATATQMLDGALTYLEKTGLLAAGPAA